MINPTVSHLTRITSLLLIIALSACGVDDGLILREASPNSTESEGMQYVRSLQLLRYFVNGEEREQLLESPECGIAESLLGLCSLGPDSFAAAIRNKCNVVCENTEPLPPEQKRACSQLTCAIEHVTCTVNELLDLASSLSPITYHLDEDTEIVVPSQTFPVQTRLRELAFENATTAASMLALWMGATFFGSTMFDFDNSEIDCSMPRGENNITWFDALKVGGLELIQIALESALQASSDYVGLADGLRGRHTMASLSAKENREIRAHAAHLIGGGGDLRALIASDIDGDPDLMLGDLYEFSSYDLPICTTKPLERSARAAAELIRESGIHPSYIAALDPASPSYLSTEDLLVGNGGENIKNRIASYRNISSTIGAFNSYEFAAYFGLTIADFLVARAHLAEQHRIFRRSSSAVTDDLLPPDYSGDRFRYAATVNPPTPPHWARYAATYSHIGLDKIYDYEGAHEDNMLALIAFGVLAPKSVTSFYTMILNVLTRWEKTGDPNAIEGSYERSLYQLALDYRSHLFPDGTAYVITHYDQVQDTAIYEVVAVTADNDHRYAVVSSDDSLECAVKGRIEGVACRSGDLDLALDTRDLPIDFDLEQIDIAAASGTDLVARHFGTQPIVDKRHLYLLRTKDTSGIAQEPGAWEVVGVGSAFPVEIPGQQLVMRMHLEPSIFQQMGTIMTPSTRWCAQPSVHCGEDFDPRIPLEDELTDDGSVYENSWRRYLSLAREAADFADSLGQEARNAAMSMDELAQGALTDLQELCGSVVSLDPFQGCDGCESGLTPEEILARNLIQGETPDLMRLERCIGHAGKLDFATLGDQPLCAWTIGDDNSTLCQLRPGDETDLECPRFRFINVDTNPDANECRVPNNDPAYQPRTIGAEQNQLLGFFSRPDNYVPSPPTLSCNDIRSMREKFTQGEGYLTELVRTFQPGGKPNPFWMPERLGALTDDLNWTAKPGNFSSVRAGSNVLATTGDFMSGTAASGVCATSQAARMQYKCDAEEFADSIFCTNRDCSNETVRRDINARLARAAIIAKMFALPETMESGLDYKDFVLPMHVSAPKGTLFEQVTTIHNGALGDRVNVYREPRHVDEEQDHKADIIYYEYPLNRNAYWEEHVAGFVNGDSLGSIQFRGVEKPMMSFLREFNNNALYLASLGGHGHNLNETSEYIYNRQSINWIKHLEFIVSIVYSYRGPLGSSEVENLASIGTFFDTLELICEASHTSGRRRFGCDEPAPLEQRQQIYYVADKLECLAENLDGFASRFVFTGLPESALDALRESSTLGALPADGGEYAQSVSRIRQRLMALGQLPAEVQSEISGLARDVRRIAIEFERSDIQSMIGEIDLLTTVSDHLTTCATTMLQGTDAAFWAVAGKVAAAALTCHNSMFQIVYALGRQELQLGLLDLDRRQLLIDIEESLLRRMDALDSVATQLVQEAELLDAELTHLESIRLRARRALYRGLFMSDPEVQKAFSIEGSQRQRLNTAQVRYEHARRDAVRMAFLAKRAIEQRFGVELAALTTPMTLVEAPSTWEGRACVMQGIRTHGGGVAGSEEYRDSGSNYAEEFIGDWVRKLERFVDSYRVDYPFSDGTDTAVVSLRDDVIGSRASCEVWAGNLFAYSNQLTASGVSTSGVWSAEFCTESEPGVPELNCVSARAIDEEPSQPIDTPSAYGDPTAYSIHFGPPVDDCVPDLTNECPCNDSWCGFNQDVVYGQRMWLGSGRYQISYYARGALGDEAMVVRRTSDSVDLVPQDIYSAPKGNGFARYWYTVHIPEAGDYIVGFVPPSGAWNSVLEVAGPSMVEVRPSVTDLTLEPPPFAATDANGMRHVPVCEDSSGSNFRREAWTHHCVDLCSYGFSEACNPSDSTRRCYWETEFYVSQRDIDRGNIFASSGFARGNFNYRLDSLALNFVGSAARVCLDPAFPSTCYNAGWLPFSLEHRGPYTVLNNFGDHYEASLFTGRIEQSRGLAAERYLTNPISSADFSLISQYTSTQLRGRPLTGWYVLRVWDEPGVNFEGIEDVQLVMNYRFWTRNN